MLPCFFTVVHKYFKIFYDKQVVGSVLVLHGTRIFVVVTRVIVTTDYWENLVGCRFKQLVCLKFNLISVSLGYVCLAKI